MADKRPGSEPTCLGRLVDHTVPRDDLAIDLLCAFNGIRRDQMPKGDVEALWVRFANPSMAAAWGRVAEAARLHFEPVALVCIACGQPWTGETCGQKDNGWPHLTCSPIPAVDPLDFANRDSIHWTREETVIWNAECDRIAAARRAIKEGSHD